MINLNYEAKSMKINLSNPYIFWIVILMLTLGIILYNTQNRFNTEIEQKNAIQEQSLSKDKSKEDKYIIDLDNIESAKTYNDLKIKDVEELSFSKKVKSVVSGENIFTIIYGFLISILFIFREKQNRDKIYKLEKVEDELSIQLAKQKTTIYKDISKELENYKDLIRHDINLELLNERIEKEPKYIIIASKNILEQIITKMYKKYHNQENTNLNVMLGILYKNRKLNHDTNNYAHIIKAFGNKANHTSKIFDSREATLSISNLIEFLKAIEKKGILEEIDV